MGGRAERRGTRWARWAGWAWLVLLAAAPGRALIVSTDDTAVVDAFTAGAEIEDFEGLTATPLSDYGAGQMIDAGSRFNARDAVTGPTFNSGGGSPGDPIGNPGAPIGIVSPTGAIAGDVVSGSQVAAPLVIFTDEPWNGAFLEVIFLQPVQKVGFWVPHGSVDVQLRDVTGNALGSGDFEGTASEGSFLGFERASADIVVVAVLPASGVDAFTLDDFFWARPVPEPAAPALLGAGALTLLAVRAGALRRRGGQRRMGRSPFASSSAGSRRSTAPR